MHNKHCYHIAAAQANAILSHMLVEDDLEQPREDDEDEEEARDPREPVSQAGAAIEEREAGEW